MSARPENVGIKALEIYFPNQYVDQTDLEKYMGVSPGKFTLGLGQATMAFCDDREDIYSILLTTVSSLLKKYSIPPTSIGRLEVGTETVLDKAKSCKSVLMQLFSPSGNSDIEGIDTIHACYGGTNALFNAVNWIESSSWDGRDAIVVMGDIAMYDTPAARPTGGVGCVAMLIGADAPLVVEGKAKASWMQHAYDFYKPDFGREYPVVDGHYSNTCYLTGLEECYKGHHLKKEKAAEPQSLPQEKTRLNVFDYMIFHAPYCKLVSKSYARLLYQDYLHNPSHAAFADVPASIASIDHETSLTDKTIEKTFANLSKPEFAARVQPSLTAATLCGNSYTASVYSCLISLVCNVPSQQLLGTTVGVFSYGGGSASTLYTIRVRGEVSDIAKTLDLHARLDARHRVSPEEYNQACLLREQAHQQKAFVPKGGLDRMTPGTYYLTEIDALFRRQYAVKA